MSTIIHIGYHKTGTTWFQKRYYPYATSHRYVAREAVRHAFIEDTAFRFDPAAALDRLGAERGENLVLCEEGLSGYLHNGGLMGHFSKAMAHRLHAVFPDAKIVMFIRSQPEMIASCYQQYVRGGGTHSVRRYLFPADYLHGAAREAHRAPRFCFDLFDYAPLVAAYVELFGAERVFVYPYELFRTDRTGFLARFADDLGLIVDGGIDPDRRENGSWSMSLLHLARVLNRFTYRTVADKHYLVHIPYWYTVRGAILEAVNGWHLLGAPPSPERLLGADVVEWLRQRYWRSNAELAAAHGLPLAELGYAVAPPTQAVERPTRSPALRWLNE